MSAVASFHRVTVRDPSGGVADGPRRVIDVLEIGPEWEGVDWVISEIAAMRGVESIVFPGGRPVTIAGAPGRWMSGPPLEDAISLLHGIDADLMADVTDDDFDHDSAEDVLEAIVAMRLMFQSARDAGDAVVARVPRG